MAKITRDESKKITTAIISGAEKDAVKHIQTIFRANTSELEKEKAKRAGACECSINNIPCIGAALMHHSYSATVKCHEIDEYDPAVGENEAVKKVMVNHNMAFKKAILRWQVAVLKKVCAVSPETFKDAVEKVMK